MQEISKGVIQKKRNTDDFGSLELIGISTLMKIAERTLSRGYQATDGRAVTILKNFLFVLSSGVIEGGAKILLLSIIARYLGLENFGAYAYIATIVYVLLPLLALQINRILIREMTKTENESDWSAYLGTGIILRIIIVAVLLLGLSAAVTCLDVSGERAIALYILFFSESFQTICLTAESIWVSRERMVFGTVIVSVSRLLQLGLIGLCVYLDLGFLSIFVAHGLVSLMTGLFIYVVVSRFFIKPRWVFDHKKIFFIFKEALPIGIGLFLSQFFFRIDIFFLNALSTLNDVALFDAPYRLVFNLRMLPMAMVTAIFPMMVRFAAISKEEFVRVFHQVFKFILIVGLPVHVITYFFAQKIVLLIFGPQFLLAADVLKIVGQTSLFLFFFPFLTTILMTINRQSIIPYVAGFGVLVNGVLDYLLIPAHGYLGAAIATFASYFIVFVIYFYFVCRWVATPPIFEVLKPIGAGVAMGLGFYFSRPLPLTWQLILGILFYLGGLLITGAINNNELRVIRNLVPLIGKKKKSRIG